MIVGQSLLQPSKHLCRATRASVGRARESMPRTRTRKIVLKGIVHRLYAFSALPTNAMQPAAGALSRVQDGRRIQRSVLGDGRTARGDRGGVRPAASAAGPEMTFILNLFHALDCAVAAGPKPLRPASAPTKPTRIECNATSIGRADCRSDPASWKAPASKSSATDSKRRDAADRKRAPTPCSP